MLKERFQIIRPLDEMESALVRAAIDDPALVSPLEEAVVRTALSLARIHELRHGGRDVSVGGWLAPFREEVTRKLSPILLGKRPPRRAQVGPLLRGLRDATVRARDALVQRLADQVPAETIDDEIRRKALVVVLGGGGGTAYVYMGAMSLLDELGMQPALLAGASMGAVLALFRSRLHRFELTETISIVRGLSWRKLFRLISTESRYGLPAALRLFLRSGIGRHFNVGSETQGTGITLRDLPIPTVIAVAGIRRGMLPHPLQFYERLLDVTRRSLLDPLMVGRKVQLAMGAITELFLHPEIMDTLHLGADDATLGFDALDAAGFSSSVPGVIHYDMLREDPPMRDLLDGLFESRGLFRLVDGGFVDNLPARAAWGAVQNGRIGTRNALVLALNGFSPKLTTPLWLPLQRLAARNVAPNLPYAHLVKHFGRTLSPLDLVPSVELATRAVELGREQLSAELPFLCRMLAPLPRL